MATKNSKPITYSTAENFNPLEDYNVGYQVTQQSQMHPEKFGGKETYNQFHYADVRNLNRPTTTQDLQSFTANVNAGYYGMDPATNDMVKSTTFSQPTARYETKDSARIAAQHNAGITYDADIGYVPKAARVPLTNEQIAQRSRESVAKMEAANSPAGMAAFRANTFRKEADRAAAKGDTRAANRWRQSAAEETTKARQLGYTGDISKATINNTAAKPKPATATATPNKRDWDKNPPISDSDVIRYEREMAAGKPAPAGDSLEDYDRKKKYTEVKGHMDAMEARNKKVADIKSQFETNDKIKNLKGELEYDRQAEQNWKDKAAKATDPAQKEHALQMAGEYADKARKREAEIADLEKNSKVPDIKPIAKNNNEKPQKSATDPMANLMASVPAMGNVAGATSDPFAYTPPAAGPKMVHAYGNKHSSVMVRARAMPT